MSKRKEEKDVKKINVLDTRRYEGTDDEGHLKGSNLSHFNEQKAQEAEDNDKSRLNKWDNRDEIHNTNRRDLK
ncbi:MAG TPA: hypothetical protein VNS32_23755 [Flavisolibacter sp.]|nr:hypothetical protein [Flavisolibacter sp.]